MARESASDRGSGRSRLVTDPALRRGMVDASEARACLERLRGLGLGMRRIARLSGVSVSRLHDIRSGRAVRVRASVAQAILNVRPSLAPGARIDARATKRLIRTLQSEGFTRAQLAERLGLRTRKVQIYTRVTVRLALKVRALWQSIDR